MKKVFFTFCAVLLALSGWALPADIEYARVVAQDGSSKYSSINEAIYNSMLPHFSYSPIYILVKKGTYREKIEIPEWLTGLVIVGEDRDQTIIINDDHQGKSTAFSQQLPMKTIMTFTSWTLRVSAARTQLHNLTIVNDSGRRGQALALHIEANEVLVKNCKLLGNQDTLYATGEQNEILVVDTYIEGTTDYIFGSAQLFLDNCQLHCLTGSFITAASTPPGREFGFAIFNTKITKGDDVKSALLGRPWRQFAKTVFIDCDLNDCINPVGWNSWGKPADQLATVLYAEYNSTGTDISQRLPWTRQLSAIEAAAYKAELKRMRAKYLD
jgi:pectinesterase